MDGVLEGFAIIGAVILVGYLIGRIGILGPHAQFVLSRVVFFVLSPCLLFTVLAEASVQTLFSSVLVISLLSALVAFAAYAVVAKLVWKRPIPELVVGALGSGYVNANNIGIPVAVYVLGNAAWSAPVVLIQLLLFAPIALTILDISTSRSASVGRILLQPVRNPLIIASLLGVILSVTGVTLPPAVMQPFTMIGNAAVPVVLISFGMSLHGQRLLKPGSGRRDVLLASAIKLTLMPVTAWILGAFVFHLGATELLAVVVLAGLPTAQNVFNYAQRYSRGETIARDTVLITTIGAIPVLVLVAALLTG
jgi:malonate transporter